MSRGPTRNPSDEGGFTLVEMLVAIVLSAIVGTILLSLTITAQSSVRTTTAQDDLTSEARVALDRISRDLRQATPYTNLDGSVTPAITAVQNPDGAAHVAGGVTSVTFDADFNGDGCIAGIAMQPLPGFPSTTSCNPAQPVDPNDPETVTYCWGGASDQHVYLISGTVSSGSCAPSSGGAAPPLVAGDVSDFELYYRSNLYRYDANHDGITTWSEVDAAGDANGVLDQAELPVIDAVVLSMTVTAGGHAQTYHTQVDLRDVP